MKKKYKAKELILCLISKYYRQWTKAEKAFPGIGDGVPTFHKLWLGPCTYSFEYYSEREQK